MTRPAAGEQGHLGLVDDEVSELADGQHEDQVQVQLEPRDALALLAHARVVRDAAEGAGFEPADRGCRSPVFKTGAFDRSATPPGATKLLQRPTAP